VPSTTTEAPGVPLLLQASWTSLAQRLTTSRLLLNRCRADTSAALATAGFLSTIACLKKRSTPAIIVD
jgi:hypothetical protein